MATLVTMATLAWRAEALAPRGVKERFFYWFASIGGGGLCTTLMEGVIHEVVVDRAYPICSSYPDIIPLLLFFNVGFQSLNAVGYPLEGRGIET